MRLLIISPMTGQVSTAAKIAMTRGAKVSQVDGIDGALAALRAGQGADLCMVDVGLDIARLVTSLKGERIHIPVVACGIGTDTAAAVRAIKAGVVIEWDEFAFEWHEPRRFAFERNYHRGPLARMPMSCDLVELPGGGTRLTYAMTLTPRNLIGRLSLPLVIGRQVRAITERVFRRYDDFALAGQRLSQLNRASPLAAGGAGRLESIGRALVQQAGQAGDLVARLQSFVTSADDLAAARMRPYELADAWGAERAATLRLFLHATRAG